MRRLILQTSVSIDGYVAALDKSHPWSEGTEEDEAFKRWILDSVWAAGAHLMGLRNPGRRAYALSDFWRTRPRCQRRSAYGFTKPWRRCGGRRTSAASKALRRRRRGAQL